MAVYVAKEAFTFDENGAPRVFAPGALISDDDPGFKGREHLFEPVIAAAARRAPASETASAGPDEVRVRTRGRRGHQAEVKSEDNEDA